MYSDDFLSVDKTSETMEKGFKRDGIVVVLAVMKPRRLSRTSMFKVVLLMIFFTVLFVSFLFSHCGQPLLQTLPKSFDVHLSGQRRLHLTAKGRSYHRVSHKTQSNHKNAKVLWDVTQFNSQREVTMNCDDDAVLLILITSAPENWYRRQEIRKSWCDPEKQGFAKKVWQCVFMIGETENETIGAHLFQESSQFGDVLRGSYLDVYRNLTVKVLHGFDWAAKTCPFVSYILKTDDDCFVSTTNLYNFLLTKNPIKTDLYVGNVFSAEYKRAVVRHPSSRWFVSEDDYALEYYPRYASGTGYLMSRDVLLRLVELYPYVQPFPVEDAYVGYLMSILNVEPTISSRFTLHGKGWNTCNYLYLMVIHGIEPESQVRTLETVNEAANALCHKLDSDILWR